VITNDKGADKFYGTELETWLKDRQVKTVVITGVATNGAVLYTAFAASLRGFTVVVASDGVASDNDYVQSYTLFQLLNQPGHANPENKPRAPNAVTLSTTALIRFGT
jgi:nicotinamidase-related amidase